MDTTAENKCNCWDLEFNLLDINIEIRTTIRKHKKHNLLDVDFEIITTFRKHINILIKLMKHIQKHNFPKHSKIVPNDLIEQYCLLKPESNPANTLPRLYS